jgi:prepilin-type N-terminal cleavage/methylation domain-containing protein
MKLRRFTFSTSVYRQYSERKRCAGFTVVELLTVIAIVAILAAILIPSVNSSRTAADKAKTRVRFNQWAAAVAAFRSEYGYYPLFDASNTVNGGANDVDHLFHDVLVGRKRDGTALTAGTSAAIQNKKFIPFYTFSESDFAPIGSISPNFLSDGFGTTEMAVLVDRNLDGVINNTDYGANLPAVSGIRPGATDFPATGVRAGVVFYSAMPGATADAPQFIFSWK